MGHKLGTIFSCSRVPEPFLVAFTNVSIASSMCSRAASRSDVAGLGRPPGTSPVVCTGATTGWARRSSLGGRPVVVKLTARGSDEHLALARLQHTHIVPLLSVVEEPGRNLRVLCMPYFGGLTLAAILAALKNLSSDQWTGQQVLAVLDEARAVAAIVRVFRDGDSDHEELAIELLAKIDTTPATRSLAELAVLGTTQAVRSSATDALRSRKPRDYAGMLVDQIHAPMRYQIEPVRGPGSPGALLIETPRYKMLRTYDAPAVFQPGANFYGYVGYDANGMPIIASGNWTTFIQNRMAKVVSVAVRALVCVSATA